MYNELVREAWLQIEQENKPVSERDTHKHGTTDSKATELEIEGVVNAFGNSI